MIKKENLDKTSAWPFVEAKKMLRERKSLLKKKVKLHFKLDMVQVVSSYRNFWRSCKNFNDSKCFKSIIRFPTEIITFSDDMDGLRKVPDNVPNQKLLNDNFINH
jgi:lysyl-tRNA synthetase class 1